MRARIALVLGCITGLLLPIASVSADTAPAPPAGGLNLVCVGNSQNGSIHVVAPMATLYGHKGISDAYITILGSSLHWNWDHQDQNHWPDVLAPTKRCDALILLSWADDDDVYAAKFATEAYKGNPNCQVYIYTIWPDETMSFENPPVDRTEAHTEAVAAALATDFPTAPKPRVIPSSQLIREMQRMADRGEIPGVANQYDLFMDGVHPSQVSMYAVAMMVSSMLYNESPLNYPTDVYFKDAAGNRAGPTVYDVSMTPETAAVIKRTVWDILQTYPPAGMKPTMVIGTRRLDPDIAGELYKEELKGLNTTGTPKWSLTSGTLPSGLSLSSGGVISGKTNAVGKYPITIKLAAGTETTERLLVLDVQKDAPPVFSDQLLKPVPLDKYVFEPIAVTGGVGTVSWSVSAGKLPYGIMLTQAGVLVGTPGEQGDFAFTIEAQDSNPAGAKSAEHQFSWTIGPASPDSLQVKYFLTKDQRLPNFWDKQKDDDFLKIDGKFAEPFWTFDQPIAKAVKGAPTAKASFSLIWTAHCLAAHDDSPLYVLNRPWVLDGTNLVLAVKVMDGPQGKTPKDGVDVYINGRHDHKRIYSGDDIHFYIPRGHSTEKYATPWAPMVKALKAPWFTTVQTTEIPGGYTVELAMGPANFVGDGQWLPFTGRSVYGFDVGVDEGDDSGVSRQVWRGDANDDDDTSHFGTIVLSGQPVMPAPVAAGAK